MHFTGRTWRPPDEAQSVILDTVPEQTMWAYRASLHDLG